MYNSSKTFITKTIKTVKSINTQNPICPQNIGQSKTGESVFHIKNNNYTYQDAIKTCESIGTKLATAPQVEQAYSNGKEWCNYGWTDGQLALYPMQKNKYKCGGPLVMGGWFKDPTKKFGINCYGHKPKITSEEREPVPYKLTPAIL